MRRIWWICCITIMLVALIVFTNIEMQDSIADICIATSVLGTIFFGALGDVIIKMIHQNAYGKDYYKKKEKKHEKNKRK